MVDLVIEKENEATLTVYSPSNFGLENELSSYFSFYAANYQFHPKFKARMWDGKIRLYNTQQKTIPSGLLAYVKKFAEINEYTYQCNIHDNINVTKDQLVRFIDSLQIMSNGTKIDTRDYQFESIFRCINQEKILIQSPTSSGKSLVLYCIIRWLVEHRKRVILLVPTTGLVSQMYSDFEDYSSANGWKIEDNAHQLYSGKERTFGKPILISTWQTIHSMSKDKSIVMNEFFESWDVFITDEAHRAAAASIQAISKKLVNARWRLGTTGTVQCDSASKLTLEGAFGPLFKAITTRELMDKQQIVDLKIKCITLSYDKEIKKLLKGADYHQELEWIVTNEKRNRFITNLSKNLKGNTLVLFRLVDKQGKPLYEMIKKGCPGREVFYISGETGVDERELVRKDIEFMTDAIIVASVAILGTGVNIPSLENIIFASPTKSKITNLQSIGRGLRLKEGKDRCILFDISDDFTCGKGKLNYTMKHFVERLKIYVGEEFDFSVSKIDF